MIASPHSCYALIVAGGAGTRFGGEVPKQYCLLAGKPILRRTIEAFLDHPQIAGILVVRRVEDEDLYQKTIAGLRLPPPAVAGINRQASVLAGLEDLARLIPAPATVLIHDAARPLIAAATIDRVIKALETYDGAAAALPIVDALWRADSHALQSVERGNLWRAQTPQGFRFTAILAAHRAAAGQDNADDIMVATRAGIGVELVAGDSGNFKITTAADLMEATARMTTEQGDYRVGNGFDVHAFAPGDQVMICGVAIPHHAGLAGHSDADVGLHALTDAILGALGDGDIGQHFNPTDPSWKDADSSLFLADAAARVVARGGRIIHLDVTIICEKPKIGPHREQMIARIAAILTLDRDRISVKATTTEGLGFTGRSEGIAAQATATIMVGPA